MVRDPSFIGRARDLREPETLRSGRWTITSWKGCGPLLRIHWLLASVRSNIVRTGTLSKWQKKHLDHQLFNHTVRTLSCIELHRTGRQPRITMTREN
jgi:hypothetical protein